MFDHLAFSYAFPEAGLVLPGLELTVQTGTCSNLTASASQVPGAQMCAITPAFVIPSTRTN